MMKHTSKWMHEVIDVCNKSGVCVLHVGLNDRDLEGVWRWSDGSSLTYTSWSRQDIYGQQRQQPDGSSVEDCTLVSLNNLYSINSWQDVPCAFNEVQQFICELLGWFDPFWNWRSSLFLVLNNGLTVALLDFGSRATVVQAAWRRRPSSVFSPLAQISQKWIRFRFCGKLPNPPYLQTVFFFLFQMFDFQILRFSFHFR